MDKILNGILVLVGVVLLFCLFLIFDASCSHPSQAYTGTVIERSYTPSSTSTGIGTVAGVNGQVSTVVTTSTEPEKWTVIASVQGRVIAANADPEEYQKAERGSLVTVRYSKGWVTGTNYGWYISQ